MKCRYEAEHAHIKMYLRKQNQHYVGKKIEGDSELKKYIIEELKQDRKPDVIAGRMRREKKPFMRIRIRYIGGCIVLLEQDTVTHI